MTSSTYSKGRTKLLRGGTKLLKGGTKLLKGGTKLLKGGTKLLKGGTKSLGWATGGGVVRPPRPPPPGYGPEMGPVGSTRLIRGDIRKCTMLIGYCPKKAFSSIHYFLSANLYKRQERKVPVVMAHRNSRTQIHLYCLHSWSTTQTQHIF